MEVYSVTGGAALEGCVTVHGAKNSVLPILAATLLTKTPCVLHNCPEIEDVRISLDILSALGCRCIRDGASIYIDAKDIRCTEVPAASAGRMRSSVLFAGALLARCGEAAVPLPGGCPLGKRPIDLHLDGFSRMGVQWELRNAAVLCRSSERRPFAFTLPVPSVGATENLLLAATGCAGVSVLRNAAREPEITDLIGFLNACGARITGAGTSELTVYGGRELHGTAYTVMPDRMEAATYLCACAGCGGCVRLERVRPCDVLPVTEVLCACGCALDTEPTALVIEADGRPELSGCVTTAPHPGFPTDAQAPLMAALLRGKGSMALRETVFENRFHHVPELQKLGADIAVRGDTATVTGVPVLHGAALEARDLRGGAALMIAALQAKEKSVITGVKHLKRGYDNLEKNLRTLGADVTLIGRESI